MIKNSTRHNRLADGSPVPDVEGSNVISFTLKSTGNASKLRSFGSVFPVNGMAFRTFPAGVMGIDCDDWNARFPCLVFNERPDLMERP